MKKAAIALFLFCLAFASALEDRIDNGISDYHRKIGIPLATKLRKAEEAILAKQESDDGQRIVGGGTTLVQLLPYQAGIIITVLILFTSVCGGTLISDNTVLSAAHCFADPNLNPESITTVLGSNFIMTGGTRVQSQNVIIHPGFNPSFAANNIALVRFPTVTFTFSIQPIALPSGSELNLDFAGWNAVASGYGLTRDDDSIGLLQTLSSVDLQIISNEECRSVYGETVQDNVLCTSGAGGVGTCGGDFGGPLVVNSNGRRVLVGVSSFVAESGCAAGFPSGYTRVSSFLAWILTN